MKFFIVFLFIIFQNMIVLAQVYYQNPSFKNYYNKRYYPRQFCINNQNQYSNLSQLNNLERYTFNRNYNYDNSLARLERLELSAFGSVQNGNINDRYKNLENEILSRPPQYTNTKKSFLKNIVDYFDGNVTGITPSVYY